MSHADLLDFDLRLAFNLHAAGSLHSPNTPSYSFGEHGTLLSRDGMYQHKLARSLSEPDLAATIQQVRTLA